jgi:hypothetical protein
MFMMTCTTTLVKAAEVQKKTLQSGAPASMASTMGTLSFLEVEDCWATIS